MLPRIDNWSIMLLIVFNFIFSMHSTFKKSTYVVVTLLLAICLLVPQVFAKQVSQDVLNPAGKNVSIPTNAIEVAPNIFSLGSTIDKDSGDKVEGYMIVRPYKGNKKPSGTPGGGGGGGGGTGSSDPAATCYGFMANGAKWKSVEPWVLNPANSGLSEASVLSIMSSSIDKWEDAANYNILGDGSLTNNTLIADESTTDNVNEVYFARLDDDNVIGVTIIWGVFGGAPKNRRLVEWDQVYNTYYSWSDTVLGTAGKMDFESIATHELGHSVGLADLYSDTCAEQTMYGYGEAGDIEARTLEVGDIAGIGALY